MAKELTSKMIKPFDGDGDVSAWLAKVDLVAKLTKTEDVSSLIPLYLEGGALAVYLEMDDSDKTDASRLKKGLMRAFADSQFVAFNKLKQLAWTGESVDIYATELRKLAKESGLTSTALEHTVRLAFVTGMPESVSVDLQQAPNIESMAMPDILARARVLVARGAVSSVTAVGAQARPENDAQARRDHQSREVQCYECGGPHFYRGCPQAAANWKRGVPSRGLKCYTCGGAHIARNCPKKDCASGCPVETVRGSLKRVPVIDVVVDGKPARALVDTGCTLTMVGADRARGARRGSTAVLAFDGREVMCLGYSKIHLEVGGERVVQDVRVVDQLVGGLDVVIGMDIIDKLGGVTVAEEKVKFGARKVCAVAAVGQDVPVIEDEDFEVHYDGQKWTVRYFWNENGEPKLNTKVSEYTRKLDEEKMGSYKAELERWIAEGILIPWEGRVDGVLPLMAVDQVNKNKVRPVLDFRELNEYVKCHTGDEVIDICDDKMREWRRVQGEPELVDLKSAYLQIRVSEEQWKHQLVQVDGKTYCLTRLGFGLNVAPKIMAKILKHVLAKDPVVNKGTSSYVDDIYVNKDIVSGARVVAHLRDNGLAAKEPVAADGGAALGMRLRKDHLGALRFQRSAMLPDVTRKLTKRELFSVCGKLVGHYPVAGWLRLACSYIKRHAAGTSWKDYVGDETQRKMEEIVEAVKRGDPVEGRWDVPATESGTVWTDASDLAMGVLVEIGGVEAEDGTWMRKQDDYAHINVAELEALLKGINMCVKWGLKNILVKTDSATVVGWVRTTLSGERRVKTKGAAEMLIKRRLSTLRDLVEEMNLTIELTLVKSGENKADALTRVWKRWLVSETPAACMSVEEVRSMHRQHHMGVERTWFLAKKVDPDVSKDTVKRVVRQCEPCQSIDPAPARHAEGKLHVDQVWERAAIDVTHYRSVPYLSLVDCGPGRFAIWRKMKGETAAEISRELESIFFERGPVKEVLLDNAPAFHAEEISTMLSKWGVRSYYRAAYRASGNGIVERHHRTIKAMAERLEKNPIEAVYWYNVSPKYGQREDSVPQSAVHTYTWKLKGYQDDCEEPAPECEVRVGDEVWVKPGKARCTTKWQKGVITGVCGPNNVQVDGMARHILDIRGRNVGSEDEEVAEEESPREGGDEHGDERRYPSRARAPPSWMDDYVQK